MTDYPSLAMPQWKMLNMTVLTLSHLRKWAVREQAVWEPDGLTYIWERRSENEYGITLQISGVT